MFDIGWSEMAVIALLLLIVIGPKELPTMLRTVGRYVRKARMLTRDFQHSLDEMAREAELDEAKKTIQSASTMNLQRSFEDAVDPEGEVKSEARALDATARDTGQKTAAPETQTAAPKEASQSAAPANGSGKTEAAAAPQQAEPPAERAEHRVQPASPAPPHSVTPPAEEPVASKTGAG